MTVAEFKKELQDAGYSIKEFAKFANVSYNTVTHWKKIPSWAETMLLCMLQQDTNMQVKQLQQQIEQLQKENATLKQQLQQQRKQQCSDVMSDYDRERLNRWLKNMAEQSRIDNIQMLMRMRSAGHDISDLELEFNLHLDEIDPDEIDRAINFGEVVYRAI